MWKNQVIILIVLGAILLRAWGFTRPFGAGLWDIGFQAYLAKNHYLHGILNDNFLNVVAYGSEGNIYHLTHPPLVQIFIYLSFLIFGVTAWAAKLVPIFFSVGSLILVYLLVLKVWDDKKVAWIAAIVFAVMPMAVHFGRVVNFEAVTLFFVVLTLYSYLKLENKQKWTFVILLLGITGGLLSDWAYYFILPAIFLHAMFIKRNRKEVFLACGYAFIVFLLYLSYVNYIVGEDIVGILGARVEYRSGYSYLFDGAFYKRLFDRNYFYFTSVPLACSVGYLFLSKFSNFKSRVKFIIPLLFFQPFIYLVLFPQAANIHNWHLYYFNVIVSIIVGLVIGNLIIVKGRIIGKVSKLFAVGLFMMFLFQAGLTLYEINVTKYDDSAYQVANLVNEYTAENDKVYLVQYLGPEFYFDVPLVCNMLAGPDFDCVKKYNPKFVIYLVDETEDSFWDRSAFEDELLDNYGYYFFNIQNQAIVFSKDENLIYLTRNFDKAIFTVGEDEIGYDSIKDNIRLMLVGSSIDDKYFNSIFQHALREDNVYINYAVDLKNNSSLSFGIELLDTACLSGFGDGVVFQILVQVGDVEDVVFSEYIDPKNNEADCGWHDFEVNLSKYDNQSIILKLVTLPGPENDNNSDWAVWGDPIIKTF